jgi:hypothetical protein
MSDDLEKILRKSLDEADRYRKRVILGSFILACIVAAGLGWLDRLKGQADVNTMLFFGVVTLLISQVAVAVVTWGVVTDLARKTLKAIELLSRE